MNDYRNIIAVTNRHLCEIPFLNQIERICSLRPATIVLREKDLPKEEYEDLARSVKAVCDKENIPLTIHFYPEAAVSIGIKRIHLPLYKLEELGASGSNNAGRLRDLFDEAGCSVHSVEEAVRAEKLGATYLTAGHIYTTDCKKGLEPRGLKFLRKVCEAVSIPVYAIGGIGRDDEGRLNEVLGCGAAGACIMSGMMGKF